VLLDGRLIGSEVSSPPARLTAPLFVNGSERGAVEVLYAEDRPRVGEDPFLAEEHELLATVARQLSSLVERHEAREEKQRLESKLRHADRLATIGTLAAGVAHELNEPLGAVLGFAQLAAGADALPENVAGDLAKIEEAALHARSIVRQLMLFARRDLPKTQPTELDTVVQGALSLVRARCKKAGVSITDRCAAERICIDADPSRLQQVVVNLLVNAVQAMPDGGTLTVRTRGDNENAVLEVEDTGHGMDEATKEQVFVPFYTTKEVNVGTGLGLAVVHGIVTAHGGSIRVDSTPGKGTVFEVQIPRCGCAPDRAGGEP
jgi:signal transduction histidine kinase